jgi:AcrR family transcriptional regulator
MFTKKVNFTDEPVADGSSPPRRRGRPSGTTVQGHEARKRLYETAIELIGRKGYEATTLRDVAETAGVSVGLLYKYFPGKRAVVLAFYDELSGEYAARAGQMKPGRWRDRFVFALRTCLEVLGPHRKTLSSLAPVLVADSEEGLFAARTAFSRKRVEQVFQDAVSGAIDAPAAKLAEPLGRLLYMLHLSVILWWLLDKSPKQWATHSLVTLLERILPSFGVALMLPKVRGFVQSADVLVREALFDDGA